MKRDTNTPIYLLVVVVLIVGALVVLKLGRAVESVERVEARFQSLADDLQPVIAASGAKAIEAIGGIDADQVSTNADRLIGAGADRLERYLESDERR